MGCKPLINGNGIRYRGGLILSFWGGVMAQQGTEGRSQTVIGCNLKTKF